MNGEDAPERWKSLSMEQTFARLVKGKKMPKLIDKEELIFEYYRNPTYANLCKVINDAPIIDAEPVRHGQWVLKKHKVKGSDVLDFNCSACKRFWFHNGEMRKKYKYCPNCGAKMDEGGEQ